MVAPVVPTASFPIPPPVANFPVTDVRTGKFTPLGLELFTKIWAGIQGGGGIYPQLQELQAEVAIIFGMHGDGTLSPTGELTVVATEGVPFGYFATGTDASHLTGTVPVAALPIATVATVGVVKPDGTTITIDPDGTIHSAGGGGVSITNTDGNLLMSPSPLTGTGTIDLEPNINVTGYLNVGSAGPPAETTAGDLTAIRGFLGTGTASFIASAATLAYVPAGDLAAGTIIATEGDIIGNPDAGGAGVYIAMNFNTKLTGTHNASYAAGVQGTMEWNSSGTLTQGLGFLALQRVNNGGTITNGRGFISGIQGQLGTGGTITTARHFYAQAPNLGTTGFLGTVEGLHIDAQKVTGVTKAYGVNQAGTSDLNIFAGKTMIGKASDPTITLEVGDQSYTTSGTTPSLAGFSRHPTNLSAIDYAVGIDVAGNADAGGAGQMRAMNFAIQANGTGINATNINGVVGSARWGSTGTIGVVAGASIDARNVSTGTITRADGLNAIILSSAAGTITTANTLYARSPSVSAGAITTAVGVTIDAQKVSGVTNGYGLKSNGTTDLNWIAGRLTVGAASDPAASVALDVVSTTGAFRPPSMTTTQRLALTPLNGMVVYDSTLNQFYAYQNSLWIPIIWASGGTARSSAQFNVIITSQLTASAACHGNIMKPAVNITVTGAGFSMTTVTGGVYAVGIAPYDTGTNKITAAPTYTTTYTETAGAAHTPVFLNFPTPVTMTGGTSYIVFLIRTDSTSSVAQTMDYSTGLQTAPAFYVPATGTLAFVASLAPTTSDTWTVTGTGVRNINFAYQL